MEVPDLNFELMADRQSPVAGGRGVRWAVGSVAAHVSLLALLIAVPVLSQDPLPDPTTSTVRAFLVEPAIAPPPPPPPPPAPAAVRTAPRVVPTPPPSTVLQAPIETPAEVKPEASVDLGMDGGMPGGVEGGVPGGVVGGVVGGVPDSPAPPAPRVVRVGGDVKEPTKLKNVNPAYPDVAMASGIQGTVVLEATIAPNGRVADVKVVRSLPLLEKAAIDAVKQWIYSPVLVDGVPVRAIMTVTVRFQLS